MFHKKAETVLQRGCFFLNTLIIICTILTFDSPIAYTRENFLFNQYSEPADTAKKILTVPKPVVRSRTATVNFNQLHKIKTLTHGKLPAPELLNLNLFDDACFKARIVRSEKVLSGGRAFLGTVEEMPGSEISLVVNDNRITGSIILVDRLYRIQSLSDGKHKIEELDPAKFPPELPPVAVNIGHEKAMAMDTPGSPVIDLLVVYTNDALAEAGGTNQMKDLIDLAVAESNAGYINSNVNQRLRLINTAEVDYHEGMFNWSTTLSRLQNAYDGYMDEIHTLRDVCGADEVVLIVNNNDYCGLAYMMQTTVNAFKIYAFAVVSKDCATGYYSFAHELGHNMGSTHDRDNAGITGVYDYSYGYQEPDKAFRTVMAYNCSNPGCTRVNYWSNPDIDYGGQNMGVVNTDPLAADNHLSLNNTAATVAAFRSPDSESPLISNCPSDISGQADNGSESTVITWTDPTATDNCCIASFSSTHDSGDTFATGITTVTYTATDTAENQSLCSFNVTVTENESPVISNCPDDIDQSVDSDACSSVITWTVPTASDNDNIASFEGSHVPGETFPVGETEVTYTAVDDSGNSTTCGFTVTISSATDLHINIEVDTLVPIKGDHINFTITAANDGPCDTSGINVTTLLPEGLAYASHLAGIYDPETGIWTVGHMDVGASTALSVIAVADREGEMTHRAEITGPPITDLNEDNDAASVTIDVRAVSGDSGSTGENDDGNGGGGDDGSGDVGYGGSGGGSGGGCFITTVFKE